MHIILEDKYFIDDDSYVVKDRKFAVYKNIFDIDFFTTTDDSYDGVIAYSLVHAGYSVQVKSFKSDFDVRNVFSGYSYIGDNEKISFLITAQELSNLMYRCKTYFPTWIDKELSKEIDEFESILQEVNIENVKNVLKNACLVLEMPMVESHNKINEHLDYSRNDYETFDMIFNVGEHYRIFKSMFKDFGWFYNKSIPFDDKYDGLANIRILTDKEVEVSIQSNKLSTDCSEIANKYNGSGMYKSARFIISMEEFARIKELSNKKYNLK